MLHLGLGVTIFIKAGNPVFDSMKFLSNREKEEPLRLGLH